MSRLFEALSNAEMKRGSLKVVPRAGASSDAVPPDAIALSVTPSEPAQGVETNRRSSQVVLPAAALADMVLPCGTPVDMVSSGTMQEDEALHRLPVVVPGTVARPEMVSQSVIGMVVGPTAPAKEVETENQSSQGLHLKAVPPDVIPPGATVVNPAPTESTQVAKVLAEVPPKQVGTLEACSVQVRVSPESRFVALTDPNSLGAEKFRALVARLDHLRKQRELKSFQVTSSTINEGKTLVAGNVAVTLAKYSGSKTLLIDGDLRRPTLAARLGLEELRGLSHWWFGRDPEPMHFVYKINDMPLWFLSAGEPCDRPSDILRSARFVKAFAQLASHFEWIVVDSTPMQPIDDVNLWSKLVDGTLLVVREGITPVKALKRGLQALDHPKLIGVVINEASGSDQANYDGRHYYSIRKHAAGRREKI